MKNESGKCALAGTFSCCIYTQGITTIRKVYNKESILISQEEINSYQDNYLLFILALLDSQAILIIPSITTLSS
jgi:hypothetical protein